MDKTVYIQYIYIYRLEMVTYTQGMILTFNISILDYLNKTPEFSIWGIYFIHLCNFNVRIRKS